MVEDIIEDFDAKKTRKPKRQMSNKLNKNDHKLYKWKALWKVVSCVDKEETLEMLKLWSTLWRHKLDVYS